MITNRNIICISSIDWDFVWQGHQEIMKAFAASGNKVLYIENTGIRTPTVSDLPRIRKRIINWLRSFKGIRREGENLFIYSPVILPFPYSGVAALINRAIMLPMLKRWMKAADFINPIIWTFLPTKTAFDLINNIDNEISIYYCIADFDQLVTDRRKLRKAEARMLRLVDMVFAQGAVLKERCMKYNNDINIFPFGVRYELFNKAYLAPDKKAPEDIRNIKGVKIGYVGGIHKHIDYDLLRYVASKKPDWSIVLIGPDQINYQHKNKPKNVILLGMKKYEELPYYIASMDACLIPYEISEYTSTVYPTKLNEYLFMGKPVISTALPEVREFGRLHNGVVSIANSKEEFLRLTEEAVMRKAEADISKRREAAMENSWEKRIEGMSRAIEGKIAEKKGSASSGWMENLARMYRASKKKMIKAVAVAVVSCLIIFYSPLVWILAEPLKISQSPRKADAIVVFGGGVGETGSPGKSTIERSRFSVDLYRQGYAPYIIYSSGYTYRYNDADNMELFALSMGVPKKDIILEKKANSTYENVRYTVKILKDKGFDSIILVSSPYNMRRSAMVFDSIAKNMDVAYVPVPDSQFYFREKHVKLEQIKAIIHEYLGIVYYIFKGYIRI